MKKFIYIFLLLPAAQSFAQVPEDALRYTYYPQNGSARSLATGGVMGSLGGDITANYVNPAGLGFYKTREFVLTPGFSLNKQQANFRGEKLTENKNAFAFGPSGVIIGSPNTYNPRNSSAFSFAVTQTANFNNRTHYKGFNNFSSFSEMLAEEFSASGRSIRTFFNAVVNI